MNIVNTVKIVIKYADLRKRMMNAPYNYSERDVMHTVWRLLRVAPEIQAAFVAWFDRGVKPTLSYAGVSFDDLMENKHWNEFNTFLFMDLLRRDPVEAKVLLAANTENLQTLSLNELRPDLREGVQQAMQQKQQEDELQGRGFSDRDEFVLEEGKSLVFKLDTKKEQ